MAFVRVLILKNASPANRNYVPRLRCAARKTTLLPRGIDDAMICDDAIDGDGAASHWRWVRSSRCVRFLVLFGG